jgi:protoporphyrinogen oxidase
MAWMWARFKARSAKLGTYRGGFQAFLDDFTRILKDRGVLFNFSTTVTNISEDKTRGLQIELAVGSRENFDQVLVTLPPHLLLKLAPALPEEYTKKISGLQGTGAIVMVFALNQRLSEKGYYWFNLPKSAGFPFLALVEHTNFMDETFFNGDHIVYCGDYLDKNHPYFSFSENELAHIYLDAFKKINPNFSNNWIKQHWLFKTPFAQPIPEINHSQRIPEIETPINGLFLASMSQIYPWDRGTNFSVSFARKAAKSMLSALQRP